MSLKPIAIAFVQRAEALGMKGKSRDNAAIEFFLGAYVAAYGLAKGDAESDAGKHATHILAVTQMLVCTRGYAEVKRIAEKE